MLCEAIRLFVMSEHLFSMRKLELCTCGPFTRSLQSLLCRAPRRPQPTRPCCRLDTGASSGRPFRRKQQACAVRMSLLTGLLYAYVRTNEQA